MEAKFILISAWHCLWFLRFRTALPDMDYGQFAYGGFFAAKDKQLDHLTRRPTYLGFKTAVYYLMAMAFYLLPGKWYAPRLLFAAWNSIAASVLVLAFPEAGWAPLVLYLALSTSPALGSWYLQAEFWAMLCTVGLLALFYDTPFAGRDALFGVFLFVNPFLFKITCVFESLAFFLLYDGGRAYIVSGITVFGLTLLTALRKTRILQGTLSGISTGSILNYFLRWGRNKKISWKTVSVFRHELFLIAFPLLVLGGFAGLNLWLIILSQALGGIVQLRGFRHHFMTLVPSIFVLASGAPEILVWLTCVPALWSMLRFTISTNHEAGDWLVNRSIPHYHKRNVASFVLARWIEDRTNPADRVLVIGETPQLNVLAARRSPRYFLDFDPHTVNANKKVMQESILKTCRKVMPKYAVVMQDCVDWDFLRRATGLVFARIHEIHVDDETFPVYECVGREQADESATGDLFVPCKLMTPEGRHIYNHSSLTADNPHEAAAESHPRCLFLNPEYPPLGGGAGKANMEFARRMPHAATLTMRQAGEEPRPGRVIEIFPTRSSVYRGSIMQIAMFGLSAAWYLLRLPSKHRPEIIVAFFAIPSGLAAYVAKFFLRIPYIVFFRGADMPGFTPETTDRYHNILGPCLRAICANASALAANGQNLVRLGSEHLPDFAINDIPNGIDKAGPDNRPTDRLVVAVASRLIFEQKGMEILPKVWKSVRERFLDLNPQLHVFGDGPAKQWLADRLEGDVTFRGWVPREILLEELCLTHLFLHLSTYEGVANSLLEALAAGCLVLLRQDGGDPTAIGAPGVFTSIDDVDMDAFKAASMGNRTYANKFDWDKATTALDRLVKKAASTPADKTG